MEIFHLAISILVLLFTFFALSKVVDLFFVESLEIISKRLRLSSDIAGATFMAVGSSAPELFTSILALTRAGDSQAIGAGTIVGSAIFNILVIVGCSAYVRSAKLTWQPVIRDLAFYALVILLLLLTFIDGKITLLEALGYVMFYVVYLFSFKFWKQLFPYKIKADSEEIEESDDVEQVRNAKLSVWNFFDKGLLFIFPNLTKRPNLYMLTFVISVGLIGILTHFMIESAVEISHFFNIPSVIIGLTILAAGTSVPDLLSSIKVANKGKGDMAISNAVGSNIFDIAIGLGIPWLFVIIFRNETVSVVTENLNSSIVLLFATVLALLGILIAKKWRIGSYIGLLLIGSYIAYVVYQILLAFGLV